MYLFSVQSIALQYQRLFQPLCVLTCLYDSDAKMLFSYCKIMYCSHLHVFVFFFTAKQDGAKPSLAPSCFALRCNYTILQRKNIVMQSKQLVGAHFLPKAPWLL